MRKLFAFILSILLLAALAGCGGGPAKPTDPANPGGGEPGFCFEPKGVKIVMGAHPDTALPALGEALHSFEKPSCAINARDTTYNYPGFDLTVTYPDRGEDYITNITFADDTYFTAEGITIGSDFDEVMAAYGTDYEEVKGHYTYTRGRSTLEIAIIGGAVEQIIYDYLFD